MLQQKKVVRLSKETHTLLKTLASNSDLTIEEYLQNVITAIPESTEFKKLNEKLNEKFEKNTSIEGKQK